VPAIWDVAAPAGGPASSHVFWNVLPCRYTLQPSSFRRALHDRAWSLGRCHTHLGVRSFVVTRVLKRAAPAVTPSCPRRSIALYAFAPPSLFVAIGWGLGRCPTRWGSTGVLPVHSFWSLPPLSFCHVGPFAPLSVFVVGRWGLGYCRICSAVPLSATCSSSRDCRPCCRIPPSSSFRRVGFVVSVR